MAEWLRRLVGLQNLKIVGSSPTQSILWSRFRFPFDDVIDFFNEGSRLVFFLFRFSWCVKKFWPIWGRNALQVSRALQLLPSVSTWPSVVAEWLKRLIRPSVLGSWVRAPRAVTFFGLIDFDFLTTSLVFFTEVLFLVFVLFCLFCFLGAWKKFWPIWDRNALQVSRALQAQDFHSTRNF